MGRDLADRDMVGDSRQDRDMVLDMGQDMVRLVDGSDTERNLEQSEDRVQSEGVGQSEDTVQDNQDNQLRCPFSLSNKNR